jgi:PIN domain nuclease of toxin-antitoxin system
LSYLLDTHTFLWAITESPELSAEVIAILENSENQLFLSVASLWEIAIKLSIGKLRLTFPFDELPRKLAKASVQVIDIKFDHLRIVSSLPLVHRDPFDRLIVAQALSENLILLTKDELMKSYSVQTFWNS